MADVHGKESQDHVCIILTWSFFCHCPHLCLWLALSTGMYYAGLLTCPWCGAHCRNLSLQHRFLPRIVGFMLLIFLSIGPSNSSTSSIYYHRNVGHLGAFSYLPQFYAVCKHFLHLGLCSVFLLNISRERGISLEGEGYVSLCPVHRSTHIRYLINYLNA